MPWASSSVARRVPLVPLDPAIRTGAFMGGGVVQHYGDSGVAGLVGDSS